LAGKKKLNNPRLERVKIVMRVRRKNKKVGGGMGYEQSL
jgi:hypothetical protein